MCGSVRYVTPLPLSRRHGLTVHRTVGVTDLRELFDCPSVYPASGTDSVAREACI
jgi:hypothetical protein